MLALRCPECGLLLDIVQPEDYVIETRYCANCDDNSEITDDCIEVAFKVVNNLITENIYVDENITPH